MIVGLSSIAEAESKIYLIGNSLTWDTVPQRLDGDVQWHVDCGKSLAYIDAHPEKPCVKSSTLWPKALKAKQYDIVSFQPHYGANLDEDLAVISKWVQMQPKAIFVIHTGWAKHVDMRTEYADDDAQGPPTHSTVYYDELLRQLREKYPKTEFRSSRAMDLLKQVLDDLDAEQAPLESVEVLYRDAIHMTTDGGRYLMHNSMRIAMGQPISDAGFSTVDPAKKPYFDKLLKQLPTYTEEAKP